MGTKPENQPVYSDIITYFEKGEVTEFTVDHTNILEMKLKDGKTIEYQLRDTRMFMEHIEGHLENVKYDLKVKEQQPWWVQFLPYVIIILVLVAAWTFFINKVSKGTSNTAGGPGSGGLGGRMNSFTKARTKMGTSEKEKVTFKDVAGADEEKEELEEIVDFLKAPEKFSSLGAKIPKGVLLMGSPGTGKTLLAKAVAGEAGVPFFSISGSDFVEMYVGVGASRVRDLFETAKKSAPCIIFIDEIDAVGRHRGAGWGGGHDEREQTLNQLLVEMDGFGGQGGVIVIAATNRPDILDPALLRPGRFDRQIAVNVPDIKGREEILKVHARNKKFEEGVNFTEVARATAGFTGADLANVLNEAALLAVRKGKSLIGMTDIEEAIIKVMVGPQKKSRAMKEEEKRATAYHEAGHAIVSKFCKTQNPVQQISIIPSGRALGYTLNPPTEDRYSVYKGELKEKIAMLLGGRAAESLVLHDISGGASNDIERATDIARKMVTQLGMSEELGPIVFGTGHDEVFLGKDFSNSRNYSEDIAAKIDKEIHDIVTEAYNLAINILKEHMDKLHFISEYLVKNEIMDGEQFLRAFDDDATFEALDEIKARKEAKSREENEKKAAENKEEKAKASDESEDSEKTEEKKLAIYPDIEDEEETEKSEKDGE
ncbi:MAG: ATP-dependent zinc metalloprotease FtsH [Ruminococcaceae bacterium]|nr:ATP-dependent zinc metalloprotease FtsH [Oscillospiraceae bacterium]